MMILTSHLNLVMQQPARKVCIKLYDWQLKLDDAKCDDPFIENLEPENITTILLEHYGKGLVLVLVLV